VSAWLNYSLARIGIFGAVFALLYLVGITWWVSAIFAAVISFTAAYVFLANTRAKMAEGIKARMERRRQSKTDDDAAAEDSL